MKHTSIKWRLVTSSLLIIVGIISTSITGISSLNNTVSAYTYTETSLKNSDDCEAAGGIWKSVDRLSYCQMTSRPDQNATVFAFSGWLADCLSAASSGGTINSISAEDIMNYDIGIGNWSNKEFRIGHIIAKDDGKLKCSPDNIKPKVKHLGYSDFLELLKTVGCRSSGVNGSYYCSNLGSGSSLYKKIIETKYGSGAGNLTNPDKYYIALNTFIHGCQATEIADATSATENAASDSSSKVYKIIKVDTNNGKKTTAYFESKLAKWRDVSTLPNSVGWDDGAFECQTLANMTATYANSFSQWVKDYATAAKSIPDATDSIDDAKDKPTCGNTIQGIGWIMCPGLNTLVNVNDAIFKTAEAMLTINPLKQESGSNTIYAAWSSMRNIANVVFVIFFLVIIYSQLTSTGITNYGIKKMLPRLIICAIAVNLSFLIMQITVDVFNIFGTGLYDLLKGIAPDVPVSWTTLIKEALVPTLAVGTAIATVGALAMGLPEFLFMIAPAALMAFLAWMAAFLTLLIRQIAIPLAAIISPLAFVAYLLPNTQSWFNKWKDLLLSMLMMYPLAALVFGGAQFAAATTAGSDPDPWHHFLALVILSLPMFSLPFLVRQGGPLLSKVGGALNKFAEKARNPVSNWANEGRENARFNDLTRDTNNIRNPLLRRMAQYRQAREGRRQIRRNLTDSNKTDFSRRIDNDEILDANGQPIEVRSSGQRFSGLDARVAKNAAERRNTALSKSINAETTLTREDVGNEEFDAEHEEQRANAINARRLANDRSRDAARYATELTKTAADTATQNAQTRTESQPGMLRVRAENTAATESFKIAQANNTRIIEEAAAGSVTPETSVIDTEVRAQLQTNKVANFVTDSATKAATRVQTQNIAEAMLADSPTGGPSPDAVAAAGIAGPEGIARVQAVAQQAVDNAEKEEIQARAILIDSGTDPNSRITNSVRTFMESHTGDDIVGVRASVSHLLSTGGAGKTQLGNLISRGFAAGDDSEIARAIKSDVVAAGIKEKDVTIDTWATDPTRRTLGEIMADPRTYSGLGSEQLSTQSAEVIDAGIRSGGITPEMATAALGNQEATKNMNARVREMLEDLSTRP